VTELPRGTVTFLFTDIEGSTRLLRQLGAAYGAVLGEQRRILRDAAERHGGREVDTQGDSSFFAFGRANAAVAAAVEAQREIADHAWSESTELRVRMGLHTGEPVVRDDRYVGLDVHRAARIGAAAHGGQVLLSSTTRELIDLGLEGVSARELGSYRLKDFDNPERLSQLDIEGLPHEFPPVQAEKVAPPRSPRRQAILFSALAGVIAAAVAVLVFAFGQGGSGAPIAAAAGDSVAFVDAGSTHLVADPLVGATPTTIAVGDGGIWVANSDGDSVTRIDPATKQGVQTILVGNGPSAITTGGSAVWVANSGDGTVSRIDPGTNTVVQQPIKVGNDPVGIAYARGRVWVADSGDGTITRIDAASGRPVGKPLPIAATQLAYGAGSVWAVERETNQVLRIDPETGKAEPPITVGDGPADIAVGDGSVWVANSLDGTVTRINTDTNTPAATVPNVGDGPSGVAVDPAGVWVSNQFDGTLALISPRTDVVTRRITVGERPLGVALSAGAVLVAVRQSGTGHRGGTLKIRINNTLHQIDFAVAYASIAWPFERMTGDGLVAFNQASGLAGTELVPDLARSLPAPTDGGRTYTFRLRPNIRFSNGKPLRAADVRWTFERYYRVGGLPVTDYDGIVGGARCAKRPKHCNLSRGIVAHDAARTVTFHLVAPDPEFLYKLALPFGYVVPAGTTTHEVETRSLPGTGPYEITRFHAGHDFTLTRNRFFHEWSQAAQPDGYPHEIVVHLGGSGNTQFGSVVAGKADFASSSFAAPPPSHAEIDVIKTRSASQVHENPYPGWQGLFLNTHLAPFDNLDARRAVSYAIDRAAAVSYSGGTDFAATTCQILPPDFPGYRPYCPYTARPGAGGVWSARDLAHARALVARSGYGSHRLDDAGCERLRRGGDQDAPPARLPRLDQACLGCRLLSGRRGLPQPGADRLLGLGRRLPRRLELLHSHVHLRVVPAR
jgi:YVTN family beta-propeller protein